MYTYVLDFADQPVEFNCEVAPADRSEETLVAFATMYPDAIYFQSEVLFPCPQYDREHLICCSREHYYLFHNSDRYERTEY